MPFGLAPRNFNTVETGLSKNWESSVTRRGCHDYQIIGGYPTPSNQS